PPSLSSTLTSILQRYADPPTLPSFPTRRSSDLHVPLICPSCSTRSIVRAPRRRGGRAAPLAPERVTLTCQTCGRHASYIERGPRSEEHTSELQSLAYLVCRLLLEKKNTSTSNG